MPGARAQRGHRRRPPVQGRDREPARARRPLPPVAHGPGRGRADGARRSTRRCRSRSRRSTAGIAVGTEPVEIDVGDEAPERARHDRRPAAGVRPDDRRVGAARPRGGGRRAAPAGPGRADRLGAAAERDRRRSSARPIVAKDAYIVDLAWLRSTPWRERIAATFDPPAWRHVAARDQRRSASPRARTRSWPACCCSAGSRAGWAGRPSELTKQDGVYMGTAHGKRQDVKIKLYATADLDVPGLCRRADRDRLRHEADAGPRARRAAGQAHHARRQGVELGRARRLARRGRASSARASARRSCAIRRTARRSSARGRILGTV